ncbi:nad-specific glutamate dehydrogenase, partial [Nannochloropsis gaditana CCMP526]
RAFSRLHKLPLTRPVRGRALAPVLLPILPHQPVRDALIEVVPAQGRVPKGAEDLHHPVPHFQDAHIEGAPPQVKHHDQFVLPQHAVQPVGQGGRLGFPQQFDPLQARQCPRTLRGRALSRCEVCGHGDDRPVHGLFQVCSRVPKEGLQNLGRHLLGGHLPTQGRTAHGHTGPDAPLVLPAGILHRPSHQVQRPQDLLLLQHLLQAPAHEPLHRRERVVRVRHSHGPRGLPHHHLLAPEPDHRGGERGPRGSGRQDQGLPVFDKGEGRVRRPQVDAHTRPYRLHHRHLLLAQTSHRQRHLQPSP